MPQDDRRHTLTHEAAHRLAAKLRQYGIYASGKDVLTWRFHTIRLALAWVTAVDRGLKVASWAEYMGEDAPPPSPQGWLGLTDAKQRATDRG
jgi:hypothetical protein